MPITKLAMLLYGMSLVVWLRKSLSPQVRPVTRDIAALVFSFLRDDHPSPDEWLQRGRIDPRTVTASYAGMLAMAYDCASYGGEDEYQEGSERDDLEKIKSLLLRLSSEELERSAIQDACWMEVQNILSDYWSAVQALATKLLKHRKIDGRDAHLIIWRTTGYPDVDWRCGALNMR
jgi:hypothetical protein